jgi:hypothetical protein
MATKVGYIRQDPTEAINWAEVGANFSGILKEEARVREEKKAEIDRATREMERVLKDSPMGDSKNMNEWSLKYASDAQQQLLMVNTLLKSGQLKPKDYTIIRQNLADGTDQAFTLVQEYQDEYADKMARMKAKFGDVGPDGKPIVPSQELEQFLMGTAEGFGNFNASELVINPTSGNVMVGFRNENGEIDSDPNKLVGINNLRNRIKGKFDLYDMQGAITKAKAETFGQFQQIDAKLGTLYQKGLIATISGPAFRSPSNIADMVAKGYITAEEGKLIGMQAKTEDLWAESQLSNVYNVTSLLTNNLGGIAPNGQPYKFTFKADEEDENTILLQQVDGAVVPNFESEIGQAHRQTAKDGLLAATRGALDVTVAGQAVSGTTPPQQQQWQAERGDKKKEEASLASTWNEIGMSPDVETKRAKLRALLGDERVKKSGLFEINMSEPTADGSFTVDFIYPNNPERNRLGIVVDKDMTLEEWAGLGSEVHGISDPKEALRIGGGGDGTSLINTAGFKGGVKDRRGDVDYTASFATYLDKFAPAGTDSGGYKTKESSKINLYYGPDIVIPQIKNAFPELGLIVTKYSGDEIQVKIPGSKAAPLILEVDLYQTSNQGEAISTLMNYIQQNTPKATVDKLGGQLGWKSATTSGGGTGSGGSAPR